MINQIENSDLATTRANQVLLVTSAISTGITVAWVLWYCRFGFDFTDESYYLVWMENPFNYPLSSTQFGFIYHPLYEFFDGNIASLRQANILITLCLAWLFGSVFIGGVFKGQSIKLSYRLTISAALATTSLIFLTNWLPTPNYNSLNLQALLVTVTGMLLATKNNEPPSILGWLLIGLGGWLAFMAKPSTAAALGLCALLYLLLTGKMSLRGLVVAVATSFSLLVISAFAIDGSVVTFIERLRGAVEAGAILLGNQPSSSIFRFDIFTLNDAAKRILLIGSLLFSIAALFLQAKNTRLIMVGFVLAMCFVAISLLTLLGIGPIQLNVGYFQGLLISAVPFAAVLSGLVAYKFRGILLIPLSIWVSACIFLVLPYIFAFGTGNNYWKAAEGAGIFWVFTGLYFLYPITSGKKLSSMLLALGLAAQLGAILLISTGMKTPYRNPEPLKQNDYKIELGREGSSLILPQSFGHYFTEVIEKSKFAGFENKTPVIDLTGHSPGVLFALRADSIGLPWMLGGYPGSNQFAVEILEKVSCEKLGAAWLLAEPNGPRKLSFDILKSFGSNLQGGYEVAGTFSSAKGAGGYVKTQVQYLLKPIRSIEAATTACNIARS